MEKGKWLLALICVSWSSMISHFNKSHLSTDCRVLQDGLTALHLVAQGGHYECIKLLLESNCNVNAVTNVRPVQSVTNTVH